MHLHTICMSYVLFIDIQNVKNAHETIAYYYILRKEKKKKQSKIIKLKIRNSKVEGEISWKFLQ